MAHKGPLIFRDDGHQGSGALIADQFVDKVRFVVAAERQAMDLQDALVVLGLGDADSLHQHIHQQENDRARGVRDAL